jgi:hypothetical protein
MVSRIQTECHHTNTTVVKNAIFSAIEQFKNTRFWFNEAVQSFTGSLTAEYSLASKLPDLLEVDQVVQYVNSIPYELQRSNYADLVRWYDLIVQSSPSTDWAIHHQTLRIYPKPQATLSIEVHGLYHFTTTTSDSASTVWTNEASDLIRATAKAIVYVDYLLDEQRAGVQQTIAGQILKRMLDQTVQKTGMGGMKGHI